MEQKQNSPHKTQKNQHLSNWMIPPELINFNADSSVTNHWNNLYYEQMNYIEASRVEHWKDANRKLEKEVAQLLKKLKMSPSILHLYKNAEDEEIKSYWVAPTPAEASVKIEKARKYWKARTEQLESVHEKLLQKLQLQSTVAPPNIEYTDELTSTVDESYLDAMEITLKHRQELKLKREREAAEAVAKEKFKENAAKEEEEETTNHTLAKEEETPNHATAKEKESDKDTPP